jgi:hypothetical protein
MQVSARQGARLQRPRASFTRAYPDRPPTHRIISQACRIGAFRDFQHVGSISSALERSVRLSGSARSQQRRWQVAAGPPAFPEPDAGPVVGVKDTEINQAGDSPDSASSNGAKPSNGAVTALSAHGGVSAAAAMPAEASGGGVAHRWRIVFMMAVAFVLCNMDKVRNSTALQQ